MGSNRPIEQQRHSAFLCEMLSTQLLVYYWTLSIIYLLAVGIGPVALKSLPETLKPDLETAPLAKPGESWCMFYSPPKCTCVEDADAGMQLDCSSSNRNDVPDLLEDSKWHRVNLSGNKIRMLNKFQFAQISISELDISANQLHDIHRNAFSLSRNIRSLILKDNNITTLPVEMRNHLTNLEFFDISNNPLRIIDFKQLFSRLSSLEELSMNYLNIVRLKGEFVDLRDAPALRRLNLGNANVSDGALAKIIFPSGVVEVDMSSSNISKTNIDLFLRLANLTTVLMSDNVLQRVPNFQSNSLRNLDLVGNRINKLSSFGLKNMEKLSILKLSRNLISEITEDAFCNVSAHLEHIDLRWNPLTNISICVLLSGNRNATIDLNNTEITCDCTLKWLNITKYVVNIPYCYLNTSQVALDEFFQSNDCSHLPTEPTCGPICIPHANADKAFERHWTVVSGSRRSATAIALVFSSAPLHVLLIFAVAAVSLLPGKPF